MSGIFDRFKKKSETKTERRYRRYIVLGSDLYALKVLNDLKSKFGSEEVTLLSDKKLNDEDLALFGPSSFRGQENLELLKSIILPLR